MSREDETIENWESFNEFKDLYMASLNLHSLPEGLQIHRYKFIKDEIMCTYISKLNLKDKLKLFSSSMYLSSMARSHFPIFIADMKIRFLISPVFDFG